MKHLFFTQQYEARNQLQGKKKKEKPHKIDKPMEAKWYATKHSMDYWRNQRGNLKNT